MRLWRISEFTTLSGEGGLLASGRWHSRGRPVVYLSDHPASALLETIVRLQVDPDDLPDTYKLLTIEAPDDISLEVVDEAKLSGEWQAQIGRTRQLGDDWLASEKSPLLQVPSAIIAFAYNFVLNPQHSDARRIKVVDRSRINFDARLFRLGRLVPPQGPAEG